MSDKSGSNSAIDDINFDGIFGGIENAPAQVSPKEPVPASHKNDYNLPIKIGNQTIIKNLREVSGEEFLDWAESVYSPLRTQRLDPEHYDGPRNIDNRKEIVNAIAKFYNDILIRKGFDIKILH